MSKKEFRDELDRIFKEAIKSDEVPSGVEPKNERKIFSEAKALEDFGYTQIYDKQTNSFLFIDTNRKKLCAILCEKDI
ncbi:hypothetical protein [Helicobacter sp. T3_23-1056]